MTQSRLCETIRAESLVAIGSAVGLAACIILALVLGPVYTARSETQEAVTKARYTLPCNQELVQVLSYTDSGLWTVSRPVRMGLDARGIPTPLGTPQRYLVKEHSRYGLVEQSFEIAEQFCAAR